MGPSQGRGVTVSDYRVQVREVLVISGAVEPETAYELARQTGALVVVLEDGATLESLDGEEMREHGWIRATEAR